ncbi:unnamed protein product [Arabidopsis lyrata]|uniref:Predicted protein n=1 Tax=Arabidopsis lyrata subsp. lyrata TaxID=81972 RepID=D7MU73_ARALL|nr:predicted protein [Arabidopsis lyrata subsp. lyrata]CAH8279629.1 unnamed protein product [Arabidopsis lyrata]
MDSSKSTPDKSDMIILSFYGILFSFPRLGAETKVVRAREKSDAYLQKAIESNDDFFLKLVAEKDEEGHKGEMNMQSFKDAAAELRAKHAVATVAGSEDKTK